MIIMTTPATHLEVNRPPLRGVCLIVKGRAQRLDRCEPQPDARGALTQFPRRPDSRVLSESIPLFFIGRNNAGLWVAREAEGRFGGIFLLKRSALRFAQNNSAPSGCATMVLKEPLELDVENRGNAMTARLDIVLRRIARFIPEYPPPIPVRRKAFIGERP